MKGIVFNVAIFLALRTMVFAQGTIYLPPIAPAGSSNFVINFGPVSEAPINILPLNNVCFYSLENVVVGTFSPGSFNTAPTNVFEIGITLGSTPSTSAWVLELGVDGALTPIFGLNLESDYESPSSPLSYFDAGSTWLTGSEIQSLAAGDWYAEVEFATGDYLGQIQPVPEPSELEIILCGSGLIILLLRKRFF